jgi:drug/metabolite transporter (DMT)-like permease
MLFALEALAAFIGFQYLPAATFSVLFYSYPAMVAIFEALRGERLSAVAWLALGMTLVGIVLTAPDFSAGLMGNNFVGVVMALGDAFMVAIYFMITSRLLRGHTDLVRTSAWMVTGAFLLLIGVGLVHGLKAPPAEAWVYLIGLAVVSTVIPTFAINAGIQKLGSTRSAIVATFEPAFTAALAFVLLGEILLPIQWLGGAIIIASVILLQIRRPVAENAEQAALARE